MFRSLALCGLLGTACTWHSAYMQAELPAGEGPWEAPLVAPVTGDHAQVLIRFYGDDGQRQVRVSTTLDTGAWRTMVSERVVKDTGVPTSQTSRIQIMGVSGASKAWRGAVFSRMDIGELTLRNAPASVSSGSMLLGNEILSRNPFVIDRDRGVVTFGAPAWGADALNVPLEPGATRDPPNVMVGIGDEELLMVLDTGAFATTIDAETGRELDLPARRLMDEELYSGIHGTVRSNYRHVLDAVRLGDAVVDGIEATVVPDFKRGGGFNQKVVGLLGQDVLARYIVRVDAGDGRMQLRPRQDLMTTAVERVSRWQWVPRCERAVGCLIPKLVAIDKAGPFSIEIEAEAKASYDEKIKVLLGFVDASGALLRDHPLLEWRIGGHLRKGRSSRLQADVSAHDAAALWPALAGDSPAVGLTVLDINPNISGPQLAIHEPPAGWKLPERRMGLSRNTDLFGGAYIEFSPSRLSRCIAACAIDPRCVGFTHREGTAEKTSQCSLKSMLGHPSQVEGTHAGKKLD